MNEYQNRYKRPYHNKSKLLLDGSVAMVKRLKKRRENLCRDWKYYRKIPTADFTDLL